jgi:integrase
MKELPMVDVVRDYLAKRRALGFALRTQGPQLLQFARYADRQSRRSALTLELAVRWARLPRNVSPRCWAHRLKILRPFAKFRAAFDPRTEIPPNRYLGASYQRTTPYIYSAAEIHALICGARQLPPQGGLRSLTYETLIGLLACTGLRISEALRLRQADVDLDQGVITVHRSKLKQSRLVPLHRSAVQALDHYSRARNQRVKADHFFVTERGQLLPHSTVGGVFRGLVRSSLKKADFGQRRPRLHDLRHAFATWRLVSWSDPRKHPDRLILFLAKYLGHQRVTDTYWYFSGVPELFCRVGRQFEHFTRNAKS